MNEIFFFQRETIFASLFLRIVIRYMVVARMKEDERRINLSCFFLNHTPTNSGAKTYNKQNTMENLRNKNKCKKT